MEPGRRWSEYGDRNYRSDPVGGNGTGNPHRGRQPEQLRNPFQILSLRGYRVDIANDGPTALDLVQRRPTAWR